MSDPINRDFSRWLKSEIATRFKVPVRYVLYTHKDWDHASSGGVVFADTAEFVGHANMRAGVALPPGNPPLPADAVKMDANRNGLIERSEATGQVAERFGLFDENGSGVLNGAELIRGPSTTCTCQHDLPGQAHGDAGRQARDDGAPRHRAYRRWQRALLPG